MVNNFDMHNSGAELTQEQAGEFLKQTEFFGSEENQDKFDRGKIKVYEEGMATEIAVIMDTETNQTIFYDHRA